MLITYLSKNKEILVSEQPYYSAMYMYSTCYVLCAMYMYMLH